MVFGGPSVLVLTLQKLKLTFLFVCVLSEVFKGCFSKYRLASWLELDSSTSPPLGRVSGKTDSPHSRINRSPSADVEQSRPQIT